MERNELEETKRRIRARVEQYAANSPYILNPDSEIVDCVIEGLDRNELRYGFAYCTCKVPRGVETEDKKIICPCDALAEEIKLQGHCDCDLFVLLR